MRCPTCDYALWNIEARTCPECGSPFQLDEMEFMPNGLRFCCPHCDQAYYGTSLRGHLVPSEFDCVGCGQHVQMNDMIMRPRPGLEDRTGRFVSMPWLQETKRSTFIRWLKTVGRSMVAPGKLIRGVPVESPASRAWGFAAMSILVVCLMGMLPFFLITGVAAMGAGGGVGSILGGILALAGTTLVVLVLLAIWGLCTHFVLSVTGGAAHGVGRTFHGLCYSAGGVVTNSVPCLGCYFFFVGLIWWIVSAVVMTAEGQRVGGGRAALAVLSAPLLVLVAVSLGIAGTAVWGVQKGSTALQGIVLPNSAGMSLYAAIEDEMDTSGGWPAHGVELVVDHALVTSQTFAVAVGSQAELVRVGGAKLSDVLAVDPDARAEIVARAAADLPENVIAHRLGDVVFTYHGIDPESTTPGLWIFIVTPDPDQATMMNTSVACRLDGQLEQVFPVNITGDLAVQNALRAEAGLAPIPEPNLITHDEPAVAE